MGILFSSALTCTYMPHGATPLETILEGEHMTCAPFLASVRATGAKTMSWHTIMPNLTPPASNTRAADPGLTESRSYENGCIFSCIPAIPPSADMTGAAITVLRAPSAPARVLW